MGQRSITPSFRAAGATPRDRVDKQGHAGGGLGVEDPRRRADRGAVGEMGRQGLAIAGSWVLFWWSTGVSATLPTARIQGMVQGGPLSACGRCVGSLIGRPRGGRDRRVLDSRETLTSRLSPLSPYHVPQPGSRVSAGDRAIRGISSAPGQSNEQLSCPGLADADIRGLGISPGARRMIARPDRRERAWRARCRWFPLPLVRAFEFIAFMLWGRDVPSGPAEDGDDGAKAGRGYACRPGGGSGVRGWDGRGLCRDRFL